MKRILMIILTVALLATLLRRRSDKENSAPDGAPPRPDLQAAQLEPGLNTLLPGEEAEPPLRAEELRADPLFERQIMLQADAMIELHYAPLLAVWPDIEAQLIALLRERRISMSSIAVATMMTGGTVLLNDQLALHYETIDGQLQALLQERFDTFASYERRIEDRAMVQAVAAASLDSPLSPAQQAQLEELLHEQRLAAKLVFRWGAPERVAPHFGMAPQKLQQLRAAMHTAVQNQAAAFLNEAQLAQLVRLQKSEAERRF